MINAPEEVPYQDPITRRELEALCDEGAWTYAFSGQIFTRSTEKDRQIILERLSKLDIIWEDLYILWNDLSDRNIPKMATLCQKCPPDILQQATKIKTGGAWIKMVQKYFE